LIHAVESPEVRMNAKPLALSILFALAPLAHADAPLPPAGFAPVKTQKLDQLRTSADRASLASRKVVVAPVEVQLDRDSIDNGSVHGRSLREKPDLPRITREMSDSVHNELANALRAKGYELVSAPGPGVLTVRVSVHDVVVSAPQVDAPAVISSYTREVGKATMRLEVQDSSGATRVWSLDRRIAGETRQPIPASSVSNRFWFESMFRNWAGDVASELAALS
jgi:hypothetical protein